MKSPRVSLENEQAVYEYFEAKQPSVRMMTKFHKICGQLYRPRVMYMHGVQREIRDHLAADKQIILAGNHISAHDPLVLASMLNREEAFKPLMTRVVIPGKAPLFNIPVVSSVIRNAGAIPVFRRKDVLDQQGITEEQRKQAGTKVVGLAIAKYNQGFHVAILPEGTRNKGDTTKLLPVRDGIGRIACGVDRPEDTMIVCTSTYYGRHNEHIRQPMVAVGHPVGVAQTPELVVESVRENMQTCLDLASFIDTHRMK